MHNHFGWISWLLTVSAICSGQGSDGRFDEMRGAPFTASVRAVESKNGGIVFQRLTEVARASNGSVYRAQSQTEGELKGKLNQVVIDDATSGCSILIYPFRSIKSGTGRGLSIGLSMSSADRFKDRSPADYDEMEKRSQQYITHYPIRGVVHHISLGERNANGMMLFGFRDEPTPDSEEDTVREWWDSDLGFQFSRTSISPSKGTTYSVRVTDFEHTEPDPSLFAIKDEYFPGTQAILDAKTLFMEDFAGHALIEEKIAEIMAAPGRLSLVHDRKDADLVASLDLPHFPTETKTPYNQIRLKIEERNVSEPIMNQFWISFNLRGSEQDWLAAPEVNTCLKTLWTRIETERTNSIPPSPTP